MSTFQCDCAAVAPTYPTYRERMHVQPCPLAYIESLILDGILPVCEELRTVLPPASEDRLLEIMDRLAGWCSPDVRLRP